MLSPNDGQSPSIAVVIGSGGLKTFAAIALLEFLDEAGIEPDLLVGCSGGAVMSAMRACGYTPAEMQAMIPKLLNRELFSHVDYRVLLGIPRLPFGKFDFSRGILKGDALQALYRRIFGERRLEDMRPTTLLQVTDFQSGEGGVLSRGLIADAVYASGALFPALPMAQVEGRWLTDGGFSSPCPVLEAVKRRMDVILAVTMETRLHQEPTSYVELFNHGQSMSSLSMIRSQMATAITLHHYEIIHLNMQFNVPVEIWEIEKVPYVLEVGRKAMEGKKDEILSAIRSFPPASKENR
jgi:NTE family protein